MKKPTSTEEEAETTSEAEIIIAKHRNGPTGSIKLAWQKEYTTFQNLPSSQMAHDARERASKQ